MVIRIKFFHRVRYVWKLMRGIGMKAENIAIRGHHLSGSLACCAGRDDLVGDGSLRTVNGHCSSRVGLQRHRYPQEPVLRISRNIHDGRRLHLKRLDHIDLIGRSQQ